MVKSQAWFGAFLGASSLCGVLALLSLGFGEFRPSGVAGPVYGIAAALLLAGLALYPLRRRMPRRGPLAAQQWLQFHVYGGAPLFLILMLLHTGLAFPEGVLNRAVWILSWWITISGLCGVAIQKWIPRQLASALSTEAHYDRIPELVEAVHDRVVALVESGNPSFHRFYEENLRSLLSRPKSSYIYFVDITGGIQKQIRRLRYLRRFLSGPDKEELEALTLTKLELDAHFTLQRCLRWWLYAHAPLGLILIGLVITHIAVVFYY